MKSFRSYVTWIKKLNKDVFWLGIRLTKPSEIEYVAGQYIVVSIGQGQERSYSICSNPIEDQAIELCVDTKKGGLGAQFIRSLAVDDDLNFRGPIGSFVLQQGEKPLLFIATGTGITPIRSMLLDLSFGNDQRKRELIFGLRNEQDIFWADEFERLGRIEPRFGYCIWLSQPSPNWVGKCGRVTEGIKKIKNITDYDVYLCGNTEAVESIKMLLIGQGVAESAIFFEKMR